jgi:hypothetical protein
MPVELPLFLLPAFAGVSATPPEKFALKRAHQRMEKFITHMASIAAGELPISNPGVAVDAIADANRTLRAIKHALDEITKYEAIRPHPDEKREMTAYRVLVEDFKENTLEP